VDLGRFMAAKKQGTIVRDRKGLQVKPNGRSADWIIPSFTIGCPLACTYCYVSRHRAFGNPLEQFYNVEEIWQAVENHWRALPAKQSNQCDPYVWTYDIGESTDCLAPQNVQVTRWFIEQFLNRTTAKPTFATKLANHSGLPDLGIEDTHRVRVRLSLMPQRISSILEPATSPIAHRIRAINELVLKGYEVHVNFSPVVLYDTWQNDYASLFNQVNEALSDRAKAFLKAEVIMLTHHPRAHELNLEWAPEAEALLWRPELQETKTTHRGDSDVLRYKALSTKQQAITEFKQLLLEHLPYCSIRYIF
jgi:spore photoproduct lyase